MIELILGVLAQQLLCFFCRESLCAFVEFVIVVNFETFYRTFFIVELLFAFVAVAQQKFCTFFFAQFLVDESQSLCVCASLSIARHCCNVVHS